MPRDPNNLQKMKYSTFIERKPNSENQIAKLQPFQLLIRGQNGHFNYSSLPSNKESTTDLNCESPHRIMQKFECPHCKLNQSGTQKSIVDTENKYSSQNKFARSCNFMRIKSKNKLRQLVSPPHLMEKYRERMDKTKQNGLQIGKQASFREERSCLLMSKSSQKISVINQKTQQCKQLCLEIRQKLFQETVSTIAPTIQQGRRQLSIQDFKLGALIGKGKHSQIYTARHAYTGIVVAIKIINKQTIKRENLKEEIERQIKIQSFFKNPNVIQLYAAFHDKSNIYLVMEYCSGQRLTDVFKVKGKFKEEDLAPIMKGVCKGLLELHSHNVIYRALKSQNVILSFGVPKLKNFGQSVFNPNENRQTYCGTPLEIYPNIAIENALKEDDVRDLGVLIYEFLTGNILSKDDHEKKILQMVNSQVVYPKYLSHTCLNLLHQMLNKTSGCGMDMHDILKHPFMSKKPAQISINFKVNRQG